MTADQPQRPEPPTAKAQFAEWSRITSRGGALDEGAFIDGYNRGREALAAERPEGLPTVEQLTRAFTSTEAWAADRTLLVERGSHDYIVHLRRALAADSEPSDV